QAARAASARLHNFQAASGVVTRSGLPSRMSGTGSPAAEGGILTFGGPGDQPPGSGHPNCSSPRFPTWQAPPSARVGWENPRKECAVNIIQSGRLVALGLLSVSPI